MIRSSISIAMVLFFVARVAAQAPLPANLERTINSGLTFLQKQQKVDGSFGTELKPAMTGLSVMAFLASGHTPDMGRFGANVRGGIDYLAKLNPEEPREGLFAGI